MMFVLNMKIRKKHIIPVIFVVILLAVLLIFLISSGNTVPDDSATCDEAGRYSLVAQTVGGECGFLNQFGLDANADSRKCETVTIPSDFNDTYEEYNALQKKIGLDLEAFKGREVQKITYMLENADEKYAVLLTLKGRVIGAHLTNGEYGDENKPLI